MVKKLRSFFGKRKFVRLLLILKNKKYWRTQITEEFSKRFDEIPDKKWVTWCYWDFFKFYSKHGFPLSVNISFFVDYFGAQIYKKSEFLRSQSFSTGVRKTWRNSVNKKEIQKIFDDKREFNKVFDEFLFRPWMTANCQTPIDALKEFVKKCQNKVVSKEPLGLGGTGVKFYDTSDLCDFEKLCSDIKKQELVLEGVVTQDSEIAHFSKGAVNTFRIITILDIDGESHVARAVFRMGTGDKKVDNFSSGGIAAQIDVESGILISCAYDKYGKEYIFHPNTKQQIVGYKIPDWELYKDFCIKMSKKCLSAHYVGWDIARDCFGRIVCIEANHTAGARVMEANILYGLWPFYQKIYGGGGTNE